jgi:hypothetical protein
MPYSNLEWMKYLEDNSEEWAELLRNSSAERRKLSRCSEREINGTCVYLWSACPKPTAKERLKIERAIVRAFGLGRLCRLGSRSMGARRFCLTTAQNHTAWSRQRRCQLCHESSQCERRLLDHAGHAN